jgi:hypothetical protein
MLRQRLLKYQQQQRCLFSTSKRRRRKPKLPATTKDRLRLVPIGNKTEVNADLVAERVTTRLEWMRSSIETLWKDPNTTSRPDRYELAMDGNWWRWNVLFALSPGLLIALYCELITKPEMLEERERNGDILPVSSSNSILEDLSDGLQHYIFGIDPSEKQDGAVKHSSHPQSLQQQELQQIQELKYQIQELEERVLSQQTHSNIYKRRRAEVQSQTTSDDGCSEIASSEAEPPSPTSLTGSFEMLRQSLVTFLTSQGERKDLPKVPYLEDNVVFSQKTKETIPTEQALVTVETSISSANNQVAEKGFSPTDSSTSVCGDETPPRSLWRWWRSKD